MNALEEAIKRTRTLPCWTNLQEIAPLEGGITNLNLIVVDGDHKFVVRFGDDIPEHGVLRFNELAISQAAAAVHVSPGIHYSEPGILVLKYVDAPALNAEDLHDEQTLTAVTKLVREVHEKVTMSLRGPILTFWVFHIVRDYAAFLKTRQSPYVPLLDDLMGEAAQLEQAVGPVDLVLGHNDLLPANILKGTDRYWLVDWEYGGFNSPLFDLGGLASNASLSKQAELTMLSSYFGSMPDEALLRRYYAMKCGSLLRETMWSMVSEITSEIDFDYQEYTKDNLDRYRKAFSGF